MERTCTKRMGRATVAVVTEIRSGAGRLEDKRRKGEGLERGAAHQQAELGEDHDGSSDRHPVHDGP